MKLYMNELYKKLCYKDNYCNEDDALGIIIYKNNDKIFSFCKGILKNQSIINIHTKFNIGSISKTILSVMILKMVEMKILNLDDKLVKYLCEFEMKDKRYKDITIRMLLNHSAGFYGSAALNYSGYSYSNITKIEFLKNLKEQNLSYTPGKMGIYCDDGFLLAQILIEKIFQKSFLKCLNILGLKEIYGSVGTLINKNNAFYKNENILETISAYGIAGLSSSLYGLCDFGNKILNNEIISQSTKDKLFENQRKFISKQYSDFFSFGLGWDFVFKINNKDAFLKRGSTSQYRSILLIIPDESLVVSMFTSNVLKRLEIEEILSTLFGLSNNSFNKSLAKIKAINYNGIYFSKNNLYKIYFYGNKLKIYNIGFNLNFYKEFELNNNVFIDKKDKMNFYYFKKVGHRVLLVKYNRFFKSNNILFEKLFFFNSHKKEKFKCKIKQLFDKNLWFRVSGIFNEISYSRMYNHMIKPHIISSEIFENVGAQLVKFDGIKLFKNNKLEPIGSFERQSIVNISKVNNEIFYYNNAYFSKNKVSILEKGIHEILLEKANLSKWICINTSGKLYITIPKQGRVYIFSNDGNLIFDSFIKKEKFYFLNCDGSICYIEMIADCRIKFFISFENDK